MAVEVVRRVTLAAVTGRCRWSVGGGIVTNCTAVVLLDICSVDEVDVIDGGCVTAVTFASAWSPGRCGSGWYGLRSSW